MKRTGLTRVSIALVVAAVIALGGCMNANNNPVSNGNRLSAEARLTVISTNMTTAASSNPGSLLQLTQEYITAVQDAESLLGADEAKQRLSATATQLAPYCSSCVQSLNTAAAQIGQ